MSMTHARWLTLSVCMAGCAGAPARAEQPAGPFVGHVSARTITVWARMATPGLYELALRGPGDAPRDRTTAHAVAEPARDLTVTWTIDGLRPATTYGYSITGPGGVIASGPDLLATTAPAPHAPSRQRLAFASCAFEDRGTAGAWRRLEQLAPDAVVLLGDTPYIDTTDLAIQRARYHAFAAFAPMARVLGHTPWYGTWDDHDFGRNDTDGNLPGKEHSRRAFVEYHANPSYGDGTEGVYTSFRRGPVHVFLLDTRWFAATAPSTVDPGRPTLLGAAQWSWLGAALRASDAPFKILACGMVWNEAVRPGKTDHWGTYAHEREALFRFLGQEGIPGVVLVGGDVHRSRVIRHEATATAGYDPIELVVSPMHGSIIEEANQPHPGLIVDLGEPHTVLVVTADSTREPATLTAEFINASGDVLFEMTVATSDLPLAPPP